MKIGLISDTHGYLHPRVFHHFNDCDEVWHGGDIGNFGLLQELAHFKPLRAVYGNIDSVEIRKETAENLFFALGGMNIFMTHIAGYPGRYNPRALALIKQHRPQVVICGHSHILKVIYDKKLGHLHINPGAAGKHGWHKVMTLITFELSQANITNLQVIELGPRGSIEDATGQMI
jgi:putative phosphoesterase